MVFTDISIFERVGRRNANIVSIITLTLLMLLLLFKNLPLVPVIPKDDLGGGGVTVALGWPDAGENNSTPDPGGGEPIPPEETKASPSTPPSTPPAPSDGVVTSEDPEVDYAAIAKKKEENRKKKQEIEQANQKVLEEARLATEAKRRANAEAAQRQNEEKAEADRKAAAKAKFDGLAGGGGKGKGSGNSGKPSNGGRPDGDPNSSNLDGLGGNGGGSGGGSGTGIGTSVGGGIGSRKIKNRPSPSNDYNTAGTVVVALCVNSDGSVDASSVKVKAQGTTTTDLKVRNIAMSNARSYRFDAGEDNQCGTITYVFKVK